MFLEDEVSAADPPAGFSPGWARFVLVLASGLILLFGLAPSLLQEWAARAVFGR
jgi:hypothetical protein